MKEYLYIEGNNEENNCNDNLLNNDAQNINHIIRINLHRRLDYNENNNDLDDLIKLKSR